VWAPPPGAVGQAWRPWVLSVIMRAFLPPRGRWRDLTPQLGHAPDQAAGAMAPGGPGREAPEPDPSALGCGTRRVVPFWASLIDHPVPEDPEQTTTTDRSSAASSETPSDTGDVAATPLVDLVFVELGGAPVDDQLGVLAARALRVGGILAVLTRCRHTSNPDSAPHSEAGAAASDGRGELLDPTGLVVASAQNADLLYLQHIVIPTRPLAVPPRPRESRAGEVTARQADPVRTSRDVADSQQPQHGNPVLRWRRHPIAHADLLVFAQSSYGHRGGSDLPSIRQPGGAR
jgi:hypothetical protein